MLNLLRVMVVARILTPEQFGLFGLAMAIVAGLNLFGQFGLKNAFIARSFASQREKLDYLSSAWTGNLLLFVAVGAAIAATGLFGRIFFKDPQVYSLLVVLAAAPVLNALSNPIFYLLEKRTCFKGIFIFETGSNLISCVASVILVYLTASVWGLVLGHLLSQVLRCGWSYVAYVRLHSFDLNRKRAQALFGYGRYIFFVALLTYVTSQFDALVVGAMLGTEVLGSYMVASRFVNIPIMVFSMAVGRTLFPTYAGAYVFGSDHLRNVWMSVYRHFCMAVVVVFVPIYLWTDVWLRLLFGPQWDAAVPVTKVFVLYAVFRALAQGVSPLLLAINRPELDYRVKLVEVAILMPCLYFGLLKFGAVGGAMALSLSYLVALLLRLFLIWKPLRLSFKNLLILFTPPLAISLLVIPLGGFALEIWLALPIFGGLAYLIYFATSRIGHQHEC